MMGLKRAQIVPGARNAARPRGRRHKIGALRAGRATRRRTAAHISGTSSIAMNPVPALPSATLVLLRDGAAGLETLLLKRSASAGFAGGAHVFPGGVVDAGDGADEFDGLCDGPLAAALNGSLGLATGGRDYLIAALRETFEEAGLLWARGPDGAPLNLSDAARGSEIRAARTELLAGGIGFAALCERHGVKLALGELAYLSHWITPLAAPRRFDTRFFVALAPPGQQASHDARETSEHCWIRPQDALELQRSGSWQLVTPTLRTLELLAAYPNAAAFMEYARRPRDIPSWLPRFAESAQGRRMLLPGDYAYAEIAKLDPLGRGEAHADIVPGRAVRLAPEVVRITAPNPSAMTGPGTNSYLVGTEDALAVIDPGPAHAGHLQSLLAAAGGRLRWILATHTHHDHSPGCAALAGASGARVLGLPAPPHDRQDHSFAPHQVPVHGERLVLAPGCTLRAIHTPGHASNHLCWLLEERKILFTGDHVMQGSTVVINPPDGDMSAYMKSLAALFDEDLEYLAPGHGFLVGTPHAAIRALIAHREARETKVAQALAEHAGATLEQLLPHVYADVPAALHPVALRSLLAHLYKLREDQRAVEQAGHWRPV
ncbi:MAG: MBL fold metallo-hydrolase [Rhodocyclaceae bacterium]|nr:MBL fold metallo-hydrolase [Rhodocyclaceae bacterium]MBX3670050.1 MBL fold metallo-hydrolase [Rhodocyclaceae bacterium]